MSDDLTKNISIVITTAGGEKVTASVKMTDAELKRLGITAGETSIQVEKSSNKMIEGFKKVGAAIASAFAIRAIVDFAKESITLAAELNDLRAAFKGTSADMELLNKATAGTVSDAGLYKLSNLANSLGISMEKQPMLFLLATNAVKSYGGTIEEKFEGIIRVSEGMTRGIGQLGIEKGIYLAKVKELADAEGDTIQNLDAETQKRIRLQAILVSSGLTMNDVNVRQKTMNERIKGLPVLLEESKVAFGNLFSSILAGLPYVTKRIGDLTYAMNVLAAGGEVKYKAQKDAESMNQQYFEGTDKTKRDKLIAGWENDKKLLEAAYQKSVFPSNTAMESAKAKRDLSNQIFDDLIAKAKEYGDKLVTFKEKPGGNDDSGNDDKAKKEKVSMAIEELKFLSNDYYTYKINLINEEAKARLKDGQDAIIVDMAKYEKLKALAKEYIDWYNKNFQGMGLDLNKLPNTDKKGGLTPVNMTMPEDKKQEGGYTTDNGTHFDIKQTTTEMQAQLVLTDSLKEGYNSAGNALASSMGGAIRVFGSANSLLQQFINNLVSAMVQMLAMKAIEAIFTLAFAHEGGDFVGTGSGVMKMAEGGSFIVPPGFDKDRFPLMVESGEEVSVTPKNRVNRNRSAAESIMKNAAMSTPNNPGSSSFRSGNDYSKNVVRSPSVRVAVDPIKITGEMKQSGMDMKSVLKQVDNYVGDKR